MHCAEPCDLAKALADADSVTVKAIHMRGDIVPALLLLRRCPIGLTAKQAVFIASISTRQDSIISYAEIAELHKGLWDIETTKVAMREIAEKLKKRDFFPVCELAREGILQGMRIVFAPKSCPLLRLPDAPPHTPAFTPAQPPTLPSAYAVDFSPPSASNESSASSSASAPLLQEKKKTEEEKPFLGLSAENQISQKLSDDFFTHVADGYETRWPNLMKIGFDVPAFINAAHKAPDKALLLRTWQQSLEYANFAWSNPAAIKDNEGKPIRTPHIWISGCFKRNSHYPRPANYRTPEEIAQEKAKQAAMKAQAAQDEALFLTAFEKWRGQYSEDDLRRMSEWKFHTSVPEGLLRNTFKKLFGPELERQKIQQPGLKQAMVSYDETACPAGPKTGDSPGSS